MSKWDKYSPTPELRFLYKGVGLYILQQKHTANWVEVETQKFPPPKWIDVPYVMEEKEK